LAEREYLRALRERASWRKLLREPGKEDYQMVVVD
jgi:hypothetical protein